MTSHKDLKILFVCAEVAPFSAVGGLSQVAYFLPKSLKKLGVDVRIITPLYGNIDVVKYPVKLIGEFDIPTGETDENSPNPKFITCKFYERRQGNLPVYFIENDEYFGKRANVYGYSDDHIRFGLLSKAALHFIRDCKIFTPNVIHTNDWHTGYLVDMLEHDPQYKSIKNISTLQSVHNTYQGVFNFSGASEMDYDDGKSPLAGFFTDQFYKQNALKRGIMFSDIVNTVSENYVRELMTEEYGGSLHNLFKELRGKLYGILNGLDITAFNPATDKIIKKTFSSKTITNRLENKTDLQKHFGLEVNPNIPLLSFVGRLDHQKGLELIKNEIEFIIDELNCQFIIVGPTGGAEADFFSQLEKKYPNRVGTHLMFDSLLPRKVFSGADMMLMPSRYEPGGIVAIEAMRYGCVPVVRATGGLADSVENFDSQKNTGYGFTFKKFSPESFLTAIVRATEIYRNKKEWASIIRRAMTTDFSWDSAAKKYIELYVRAKELRRESQNPNQTITPRPLYS